ncbi:hypothetical protein ACFLU5_10735 [Bacteroidota bacterium]
MSRLVHRIFFFMLLVTVSLIWNCKKQIELDGFDREHWVEDQLGCNGFRLSQRQIILENQSHFLGHTSRQIIKLLGKPDRNELFRRNQKFYIYVMEPGPDCMDNHEHKYPETLFIRFSATGLCQEIFIKKGSAPI